MDDILVKKKKKKRRALSPILFATDPECEQVASQPKKSKKRSLEEIEVDSTPKKAKLITQEGESPKKKSKKNLEYVSEELAEVVHEDPEIAEKIVIHDEISFLGGWTKEDLKTLLNRMSTVIPKNDMLKYNSRVQKLNWEKIKFDHFTADECKEKWQGVEKKLRKFRILPELLEDAHEWLKKPWTNFYGSGKTNRHPDQPKRPLTSYMLFYMDKKKKYAKKYPNMKMTELSKIMAEKFRALPESKKEKYNALASSMRDDFNEKMKKFLEEHPLPQKAVKKKAPSGPAKPQTPFKMFLEHKLKQLPEVHDAGDVAQLKLHCKEKWKTMSNKKKIPWIRWASEAEANYLEEVKLYAAENPEFQIGVHKPVLSKKEEAIIKKHDGMPDKPPKSAYSLFSRVMLKDPSLMERFKTPRERMQEIARLWKEVSDTEKEEYTEQVKHLRENYKLQFAEYLESLPEDKKAAELATLQTKKKEVVPSDANSKKLKQTSIKDLLKSKQTIKNKSQILEKLIKMEPRHPPREPFLLFKEEQLKEGLSEKKIEKIWKSMSSEEKDKYEVELTNMNQNYINKFRTFLVGLKPEELNVYSEYKDSLKNETPEEEEEEEKEDEEEEEEEEEEEDNEVEGKEDSSESGEDDGDSDSSNLSQSISV